MAPVLSVLRKMQCQSETKFECERMREGRGKERDGRGKEEQYNN